MGAGIAAYLAGPMLLYSEEHPAIDVMLMSVSVMVLAYLLGRTLDHSDPLPISLAFVPLILTMPAGAALLHADTIVAGACRGIDCRDRGGNRRLGVRCPGSRRSEALPSRTSILLSPTRHGSAAAFRPTSKSWSGVPKTRTISGFLPSIGPGIG